MINLIRTDKFRETYKVNAFLYREVLQDRLLKVAIGKFVTNEIFALEKFFYFKSNYCNCEVDIESVLEHYIENGYSFIYDINETNYGGFEWVKINFYKYIKSSELESKSVNEICDILSQKYNTELIKLQEEYWRANEKNEIRNNASFIEQRKPISLREQILSNAVVIENGKQTALKQTFYNKKGIINTYENLFEAFLPRFKLNKNLSNKKVKRFSKVINEEYLLSIYVDFGLVEANLATEKLMLPKIEVELHSSELSQFLRPKMYLDNQKEYPIVFINPYLFLWSSSTFIKKGQMEEDQLIKKIIMYFDFYSQILKVHLEFIEMVANKTISECTFRS